MLKEKLKKYDVILASGSPRRIQLLEEMGIHFKAISSDVEETYPSELTPVKIVEHLSRIKAEALSPGQNKKTLIIGADTLVTINNEILGKPVDKDEAIEILQKLSGKPHQVLSGVTLLTLSKQRTFSVCTEVWFKKLSLSEINHYIDTYKPFDKAGAYGIQEWIGHVAIEKIEGSYYNVMGLPTHRLYEELLSFVS